MRPDYLANCPIRGAQENTFPRIAYAKFVCENVLEWYICEYDEETEECFGYLRYLEQYKHWSDWGLFDLPDLLAFTSDGGKKAVLDESFKPQIIGFPELMP